MAMKEKKKHNFEINFMEIVNFCEDYNSVGYGEAKIVELPDLIFVQLWNAGFSANEEKDSDFKKKYDKHIIFDRHPTLIAEFKKKGLFTKLVNFENMEDICNCHVKSDKFEYIIEVS